MKYSKIPICVLRDVCSLSNSVLEILVKHHIMTVGDITYFTDEELLDVFDQKETNLHALKNSISILYDKIHHNEIDTDDFMIDVNTPLENIDFSVRTYHCLRRSGYQTMKDVMLLSDDDLMKIKNFGKTSLEDFREHLYRGYGTYDEKEYDGPDNKPISCRKSVLKDKTLAEYLKADYVRQLYHIYFIDNDTNLNDIPVKNIQFSARTKNCLADMNIHMISELMDMDCLSILECRNFGKSCWIELLSYLKSVCVFEKIAVYDNKCHIREITERIYDDINRVSETVLTNKDIEKALSSISNKQIQKIDSKNGQFPDNIMDKLYVQDKFVQAIRSIIKYIIYNSPEGIDKETLVSKLPASFLACNYHDKILENCLRSENIDLWRDKYLYNYPSIIEYIEKLPNTRNAKLMISRLSGKSLDAIGRKYKLTRERIRQIEQKTMNDRPYVYEDRYNKIYMKYDFSCQAFCKFFNVKPYVYYYLSIANGHKHGHRSLEDISEDNDLPESIREKWWILMNDEHVLRKKPSIAKAIMKHYHHDEPCHVSIIYKEYCEICRHYGLTNKFECTNNGERSFLECLRKKSYILCSPGLHLRYTDIQDDDITDLFSSISFEKYTGDCIQALKIFDDYPKLIRTYDIQSGYELHNLMRKYNDKLPDFVSMRRMPLLSVKAADK